MLTCDIQHLQTVQTEAIKVTLLLLVGSPGQYEPRNSHTDCTVNHAPTLYSRKELSAHRYDDR